MLHEKTTYYVIHKETLREAKEVIMKDKILSLTIKILNWISTQLLLTYLKTAILDHEGKRHIMQLHIS